MKSRSTAELLDGLADRAQQNIDILHALARLPDDRLHLRPRPGAWTALEALEHVNRFNRFYLKRTVRAIAEGQQTTPSPTFTSSWVGNKVANWARPGATTIKLPSPKQANPLSNPLASTLDRSVLDTSLKNAELLREQLEAAREVDLTGLKIVSATVSCIKFRVGDALRLIVNHDWRHIEQAERATRGEAGIRTK